ncbi:MAG: DUF3160 domain-containing protein [Bacillota bacterium]|nr:DUF3160 domain-containing protein [Bacillota bacterium]
MRKTTVRRVLSTLPLIVMLVFLLNCIAGCGARTSENNSGSGGSLKPITCQLAPYEEAAVDVHPDILSIQVLNDLSNVTNLDDFELSKSTRTLLTQNQFAVVPSDALEFFELYENNDGIPNFVTTDAMLHTYHLYYNYLLRSTEEHHLFAELDTLSKAMLKASREQYQAFKGTAWENAALRNMAYFSVPCSLLDPNCSVPTEVQKTVEKELSLISQHNVCQMPSPVMNMGQELPDLLQLNEDYTQYVPRGHYTNSDKLSRYFKAMMWYGRLSFRANLEDESRSAVLIVLALNQNDNLAHWQDIYQLTSFFAGESDDYNYPQYQNLLTKIYGFDIHKDLLVNNQAKWNEFTQELSHLSKPRINSIPIYDHTLQPDSDLALIGFRFMGQRYNLDAHVFQQLIYDAVLENPQGDIRMLPKSLDIPAAMGSAAAYQLLKESGETQYQNYIENMSNMQNYISSLDKKSWVQDLYWSWLYNLKPLLNAPVNGYPAFMQNTAWQHKDLNTFLGSWTELKHDSILYAKQAYIYLGCSPPKGKQEIGYVEPRATVYARLAALSQMTREGLLKRNALRDEDADQLQQMEDLCLALKTISEKELSCTQLTPAENDLIRNIGTDFIKLWYSSLKDMEKGETLAVKDHPAALVTDAATNPELKLVLEEATGNIFTIYVLVPVNGKLQLTRGGVYSYYEFSWPAEDRLTDKQWQKMLDNPDPARMAQWTKSYLTLN